MPGEPPAPFCSVLKTNSCYVIGYCSCLWKFKWSCWSLYLYLFIFFLVYNAGIRPSLLLTLTKKKTCKPCVTNGRSSGSAGRSTSRSRSRISWTNKVRPRHSPYIFESRRTFSVTASPKSVPYVEKYSILSKVFSYDSHDIKEIASFTFFLLEASSALNRHKSSP